jgi:hypothetical protein
VPFPDSPPSAPPRRAPRTSEQRKKSRPAEQGESRGYTTQRAWGQKPACDGPGNATGQARRGWQRHGRRWLRRGQRRRRLRWFWL